jgi:predicted N-formylglutamate amidohydrolase
MAAAFTRMSTDALILSCEHASADVPAPYSRLFVSAHAQRALQSHRGSDIGAVLIARALRRAFRCPLFEASVTRLLVDTNRSPHHARLYSEFSRELDPTERSEVLGRYYHPHRLKVKRAVEAVVARGRRAVHLSVHSFTPRLAGQVRTAEIGLLYDPARAPEAALAAGWRERLGRAAPTYRIRRNYPYRGAADGLCTWLRSEFPARHYVGIELEVNQSFFLNRDPLGERELLSALTQTLPLGAKRVAGRRP